MKIYVALRKEERQDETQFTTEIDGSADLVVMIVVALLGLGNEGIYKETDRQTDRDRHTQSCSRHFFFAAHKPQAGHRVEQQQQQQQQQQLANSMGCCKSKRGRY